MSSTQHGTSIGNSDDEENEDTESEDGEDQGDLPF